MIFTALSFLQFVYSLFILLEGQCQLDYMNKKISAFTVRSSH